MRKIAAIALILILGYMLFESIQDNIPIMIIYNSVGIVLFIAALLWEIFKKPDEYTVRPDINFGLAYFLLGVSLKSFIKYMYMKDIIIISYYILSIVAFLILTVYGLYGFFTRRIKKGSKLVYSILGLQAAWLLVMLVRVIFKK